MATFITTINYTQQGIQDVQQTTKRASALRSAAQKMGVEVKDIYWTMGGHDGLLIFEAADDETAAAAMLHLGTLGNVQTTTCRAFNNAEMDQILSKL